MPLDPSGTAKYTSAVKKTGSGTEVVGAAAAEVIPGDTLFGNIADIGSREGQVVKPPANSAAFTPAPTSAASAMAAAAPAAPRAPASPVSQPVMTAVPIPPPQSAIGSDTTLSREMRALPAQPTQSDLSLLSAVVCQQLKIENGAATAVRIADTFVVQTLPATLTVAVMVRFRGMPGTHFFSLVHESDVTRRVFQSRFEIAGVNGPCRTVLIPDLVLNLTKAGEQRLAVVTRNGVIGSMPLFVKKS
jgi:hypothetical protein